MFYEISIWVFLLIIILDSEFKKNNKIEKNCKLHRIFQIFVYIYFSIIIIYTAYKFTDTMGDFIMVISVWVIVITIICLYFKYIAMKRFNWLFILIIAVTFVGCYLYTSWFFLIKTPTIFVGTIITVITSSTYSLSKSRNKLVLIVGFLTSILIIILLAINVNEIEKLCKPVRFSLEESIAQGYSIEDNDYIFINYEYKNSKEVPIVVYINRRIEKDDFEFIRILEFEYYNNEVTFLGENRN